MSKAPIKHTAATLRPLNPLHVLRCIVKKEPGGDNRARPLSSLGVEKSFRFSQFEVSKAGLSMRGRACAWVLCEDRQVYGLISASRRAKRQSWGISHLFLSPTHESRLPDLLDSVSQVAGSHGGERVFLRLKRDDPLLEGARKSGFFPCIPETLYRGEPARDINEVRRPYTGPALRPRKKGDDYDMFRLYNASTPPEVRQVAGMTFDQWASSREPSGGRCQEFVLQGEGHCRAWMQIGRASTAGRVVAMVHPDDEGITFSLVDFALDRLKSTRSVSWLVPHYQIGFQRALTENGFAAESDYWTLVKSTVVSVKEGSRARAPAASN